MRLTGICIKVVPNEGVLAIVAEELGLNIRGGANGPKDVLQSNHLINENVTALYEQFFACKDLLGLVCF
jgi:hypothetical protein